MRFVVLGFTGLATRDPGPGHVGVPTAHHDAASLETVTGDLQLDLRSRSSLHVHADVERRGVPIESAVQFGGEHLTAHLTGDAIVLAQQEVHGDGQLAHVGDVDGAVPGARNRIFSLGHLVLARVRFGSRVEVLVHLLSGILLRVGIRLSFLGLLIVLLGLLGTDGESVLLPIDGGLEILTDLAVHHDVEVAAERKTGLRLHLVPATGDPDRADLRILVEELPVGDDEVRESTRCDRSRDGIDPEHPRRSHGDAGQGLIGGKTRLDRLAHRRVERAGAGEASRGQGDRGPAVQESGGIGGCVFPGLEFTKRHSIGRIGIGDFGLLGEVQRHHDRKTGGDHFVQATELGAGSDDHAIEVVFLRDPGGPHRLEFVDGDERDRDVASDDLDQRLQRIGLFRRIDADRIRGMNGEGPVVPVRFGEALSNERDGAHLGVRIAASPAAGLEGRGLHPVKDGPSITISIGDEDDRAASTKKPVLRKHLGDRESRLSQGLASSGIKSGGVPHQDLGNDLRAPVRTGTGAGALEGISRGGGDSGIDEAGIDVKFGEIVDSIAGRRPDVGADRFHQTVAEKDRGAFDGLTGASDDRRVDQRVASHLGGPDVVRRRHRLAVAGGSEKDDRKSGGDDPVQVSTPYGGGRSVLR